MQITLDVPEQYLTTRSPQEAARRIQLYAPLLMFRSGERSAGAATELAGVDRFTVTEECARLGIPVIDYFPDELRGEVEALQHTGT
jgi:predicted HTH domain antitoxin